METARGNYSCDEADVGEIGGAWACTLGHPARFHRKYRCQLQIAINAARITTPKTKICLLDALQVALSAPFAYLRKGQQTPATSRYQ
jgi:hypothetical protein